MSALLEVRGLGRRFGGLQAVQGVDLDVPPGGVTGLIGPNGAGKTTVFNLITGLVRADAGSITLAGRDLTRLGPAARCRLGIARTFQNIRLFPTLTVEQNVRVVRRGAGPVREVLEAFGLWERRSWPASALDYGSRRRLEMARALATGPKLLLLDEPAAGMNPREKEELGRLIGGLGVTVLLIEHDMSLVMRICHHIAVLNFGQKIADGTPAEVRGHPAVLEAYLGA